MKRFMKKRPNRAAALLLALAVAACAAQTPPQTPPAAQQAAQQPAQPVPADVQRAKRQAYIDMLTTDDPDERSDPPLKVPNGND